MNAPPATSPNRALMPDLLRAFALVGIAVVNVIGFAQPLSSGFFGSGLESPADRLAFGAMASLFLMKSYPLFAMMFGAGLAWQLASAQRSGADAGARYFRRMAALIFIGVLHFVFFWYGDILITYGLLGCLFFVMRGASVKTLIGTGAALIAANTAILLLFAALISSGETHAPEAIAEARDPQNDAEQIEMLTNGAFLEVASWRLSQLPFFLPAAFLQQGIAVFGYFCLGLAAVKAGVIDQPKARIWVLSRWVFLPAGLVGSLWGARLLLDADAMISGQFMLGNAVLMAFSAFSALGYAGLIALFSTGKAGPIRRFFARAGSASLSAYLLQSLILSLLFSGYGVGLFGQTSATQAILTAVGVGLASLAFAGTWRSFAARGPMEALLRRFTYWGRA
ncbi:putative membrane protein [Hyphomonas neptunium ATCC 15444]|uniref:DUF418 domain-containing protein n=2 Tax=Hyphomonas TaxID=85 RepID=A0A059FWM6_9PROT|nr:MULTISPECIES: DUF418 domain-containing protein [Hyphomonas]ABI78787.1 putative membrane protein [Hyphomonas neptunium ATCC 15444]KCZ95054.1 hypothetical protein HHI_07392 [Hyphomonas hirschiana VP5]